MLGVGDLLVVCPNQTHGFEKSKGISRILLSIPMKYLTHDIFNKYNSCVPVNPVLRKEQWESNGLAETFRIAVSDPLLKEEAVRMGYAQIILAKLLPLLGMKVQKYDKTNALRKIVSYIVNHYREKFPARILPKRWDIMKATYMRYVIKY